ILGERGRWLARQNRQWAWALDAAAPAGDAGSDVRARWEEGNLEQRVEALRALRGDGPSAARAKLEEVWSREKAEVRTALIAILATSLSEDDEPFLEQALSDRSVNVKAAAAELLARLPRSAYVARMSASAEAAVRKVEEPASIWSKVKSGLGGKPALKLIVDPPAAQGSGARAAALAQIVAAVPLDRWTSRFGATPEQLFDAARATDWSEPLLQGWTAAAARQRDAEWARTLLARAARSLPSGEKLALVQALPPAEVMEHVRAADASEWPIAAMLALIPTPWPVGFAREWLARLQRTTSSRGNDSQTYALSATTDLTARAIPLSLHDAATSDWTFADQGWRGDWERRVEKLIRIVRLRKLIAEETRA
ncbi:MAG: hypothetical protein JWO56_3547, partial [Acidobacteria bacterium]|nr:hypothetical protein [Acidobacteriota bacterium]